MGTRLKDIIFDKHEDLLYEDERANHEQDRINKGEI